MSDAKADAQIFAEMLKIKNRLEKILGKLNKVYPERKLITNNNNTVGIISKTRAQSLYILVELDIDSRTESDEYAEYSFYHAENKKICTIIDKNIYDDINMKLNIYKLFVSATSSATDPYPLLFDIGNSYVYIAIAPSLMM